MAPSVALVFGGNSSEHSVSCLTVAGIARAIDVEQFDVIGVGVTRTGKLVRYTVAEMAAMSADGKLLPAVDETKPAEVLWRADDATYLATVAGQELRDHVGIDVVFSVIHGAGGEDGALQGMLELAGVRYVGAGVMSSSIALDKIVMKQILAANALPVMPYVAISPRQWETDPAACLEACAALDFPVYVKPSRGGSSLGIKRVATAEDLAAAIEYAREFDPRVIVEQGVVGREVECAVLGSPSGQPPLASDVGEIRVADSEGFYDFDAKYTPEDQVALDIPANLPDDIAERVRQLAIDVFDVFAVEGLARIDFFVVNDEVIVNELNTMPGFTPYSMYPALWEQAGVTYSELITRLLTLALERRLGLR